MRRLILLRHAKSDWPEGVPDHDRPLADRGHAQGPLIGGYLAGEHLIPDLAIVSTARRAQETWALVGASFREAIPRRDEPRLYAASADAIVAIARETGDEVRTAIMIGHNPGFHESAVALVGHGDRYAFARLSKSYPTCALAVLDFAAESWREIAARGARLDRFITPKTLGGEDSN